MHRFALFALLAACAFAQPNDPFKPKPPADVDAALRARVQEFFDLHVKGEFRKAEGLVAEDTKDFFYTRNKPKYLSCELSRIDYSENFTKANAVMVCEMYIMMPGFADHPMKVPTPSAWKLEDGKWYWWVDQDALLNTPWGRMAPGAYPTKGAQPPPSLAALPTADSLFKQIQLDKDSVSLKPGGSAEVTISNGAPGLTSLFLSGTLPGVEAKLDKSMLQAGGKAVLTLRAAKGARSGVLNVQVEQTGQMLPIQINIVEPPSPSSAKSPRAAAIQLSTNSVTLKVGESAEVTIANGTSGAMSLALPSTLTGVEAKLDSAALPASGKAILTLRALKGAKSGLLIVQVEPTMQVLQIQIAIVE